MQGPSFKFYSLSLTVSFLFLTLLSFAHGQDRTSELPPLKVEVVSQPESPLVISFQYADKSSPDYYPAHYTVHYLVQNLSQKIIRATVVKNGGRLGWGSITSYSMTFSPGRIEQNELWVDGSESESGKEYSLAVDFVLFADGTTWGKDELGNSKKVYAFFDGYSTAVKFARELLVRRDAVGFKSFFESEPTDANAGEKGLPADASLRREFIRGYKFAASRIRERFEEKGMEAVAGRMADLEK